MKLNFKKIASVLTSTVMLGSTVALAAAANYPAPFVQNGNANVAVVYGAGAAITDVAAVVDITANLQAKLAEQTATGGSSNTGVSVSGGDYVTLVKPSDNINLGDDVYDVFGPSVTDDDLGVLLEDGVYTNDENTDYDYEQTIGFTNNNLILNYFQDSEYNDRMPGIGLNLSTNQVILNYSLDFTDEPQSDISGSDMVDLETTTINILGKEYYISDADNISATGTGTWTLLDTANSALVAEGETKTVSVGDKSYDVSITTVSGSASSPEVKLTVNGETTNSLSEGGTYKLTDGTYVGIKDISIRDVAGSVGNVEFSLGSGKLELRGGQSIKINDETVQEITTEFKRGTGSSGREAVDRINLVWTTQDKAFITPDSEVEMPGFGNLKLSMTSFVSADDVVEFVDGASDYLQLKATLENGEVSIPVLYADSNGEISGIGKSSSERLWTHNDTNSTVPFNYTAGDRWFVGTYNTSSDAESYYLRFTSFVNDNGINKTTIEKYSSGAWVTACGQDKKAGDTCSIGSLTITLNTISPHPDRAVSFNGNAGSSFNQLYTKSGLRINLPYTAMSLNNSQTFPDGALNITSTVVGHNSSSFTFAVRGEDRTDTLGSGTAFHVNTTSNSDNELEMGNFYTGRAIFTDPDDSNHQLSRVYSAASALVERTGQSSDQRKIKITYAGTDSYANIVLTDKSATVSSGGGSSGGGSVKVLGSVSVTDNESGSVSNRNLVVVGGSCINSVAATLLGGKYCGADFTAQTGVGSGSFLIQTFSRTGGNVATLVAGYNAPDTTNAAKYLINNAVDTTVGKKYTGTSATSAQLVTS